MPKSSTTVPTVTPARISTPPLLDVNGVAALLSLSPRSIRRLVLEGKVPAPLRLGGAVRWPVGTIERWIWSGCKPCPRDRSRR